MRSESSWQPVRWVGAAVGFAVAGLCSQALALPPVDSFADQHRNASQDAAVVVGIEKYFAVSHVPYAARDAQAVFSFLAFDRGVPPDHISLLKDSDGSDDRIRHEVEKRAGQVGPGGILWFYFAGHGAPDPSGHDRLLVGVDAQQPIESVQHRSLSQRWLMTALGASQAGHVVVLLDACFTGTDSKGMWFAQGDRPLIPTAAVEGPARGALLAAARSDQVSGALDAARHGLFTYFLLGALRGWGQPGAATGPVRVADAYAYVKKAMGAALANGGREQEPELTASPGEDAVILADGLGEPGPNLASLAAGQWGERVAAAPPPPPASTQASFRPAQPGDEQQGTLTVVPAQPAAPEGSYAAVVHNADRAFYELDNGQPPPDDPVQAPAPEQLGRTTPAQPSDNVPLPPSALPAPPAPAGAPAAGSNGPTTATGFASAAPASPAGGQWVFNTDYGWIWAPAGDQYTYYPATGYPYTYVFQPGYGWNWLVAPWVFGAAWPWRHAPYTGPFVGRYGYYHGAWGYYHPWGYFHGYRAFYGPRYRANVAAFRQRYAYRLGGGAYRGGGFRGGGWRGGAPGVRAFRGGGRRRR